MINRANQEMHARLEAAGLSTFYPQLIAIACVFCAADSPDQDRGLGRTPKDIVQEVLRKLLSGNRRWNPDKVELKKWLINHIRSEANNLHRNADGKKELKHIELDSPLGEDSDETFEDVIPDPEAIEPEAELIAKETDQANAEEAQAKIQYILDTTTDPNIKRLIAAIKNGCPPEPQELANALNLPITHIYNLNRKLKRILSKREDSHNEAKAHFQ